MNDAELNALVAEKVMGWPKLAVEEDADSHRTIEYAGDHWAFGPDGEGPYYEGPDFATDGNAMLAVIERMRELGWCVLIDNSPGGDDPDCNAEFWKIQDCDVRRETNADTLPRAVALAAVGS